MDFTPLFRVGLVYAHLLLCVFALQAVLSTDWRLLRSQIGAASLQRAHRQVAWLFAGLWLSGLALVAIDTGFGFEAMAARPKLVAKLVAVALLTVNGAFLRLWCFPRLVSDRPLGRVEAMALMSGGALSTTSWLIAAFFGIARGLEGWRAADHLGLYGAALVAALALAWSLEGRLRQGRVARLRRRPGPRRERPAPRTGAQPTGAAVAP